MEKLVEKWEVTKLLSDCKDESEKIQLATALDEMAETISGWPVEDQDLDSETKAGILIPLVAGIFYEGVHDIKIDRVISIVDELFPQLKKLEESNITGLDAEAEFCEVCKEKYIETEK